MWNNENAALAAAHRIDPGLWWDGFGALLDRIGPRFARYEPVRRAGALMLGLLSGLDRKNCWTIAEHRGDATPDGLQHLLSRASWDADGVRDDLRDYVVGAFGDPDGILVVDETGDLKKGTGTVGVQRQYTGTAGRIENSQVAVYLTYATPAGHALIDRALYLPKCWAQDRDRRAAAGVPASFVAGDEVYGADPSLRAALEGRRVGYVLAVAKSHPVPGPEGTRRADQVTAGLAKRSWHLLSAGAGTKGPRMYWWARVPIASEGPGHRWLLVRRNAATGEIAYFRCYHPNKVALAELVRVAGQRWKVEESFQTAKGQAGLDEHQVRRWCSWHRWTTLAMLAMAFLAVTTATQRRQNKCPEDLIPITVNELRRLFDALVIGKTATVEHILNWSVWRRKHQATARKCHYRRRTENPDLELRL